MESTNPPEPLSRRYFLGKCTGIGLGAMSLGLLEQARAHADAAGRAEIAAGTVMGFSATAEDLHVFDSSTGKRIDA